MSDIQKAIDAFINENDPQEELLEAVKNLTEDDLELIDYVVEDASQAGWGVPNYFDDQDWDSERYETAYTRMTGLLDLIRKAGGR